jgi:hypothetical protein
LIISTIHVPQAPARTLPFVVCARIGFDSFEAFCRAKLGKTLEEVESIVAGVKVLQGRGVQRMTCAESLQAAAELPKHGAIGRGRNRGSDATSKGRGKDYLAARIKRDHPEIAARAHEFKSVRAMAIAAGIVKVKTPLEQIIVLLPKLTAREREQLGHELLMPTVPFGTPADSAYTSVR